MNYDCSIKKRKGCNYCLRSKSIQLNEKDRINIDADTKRLIVNLENAIKINYCPVCGRKLTEGKEVAMRYKFRGKRVDSGEWVVGYLFGVNAILKLDSSIVTGKQIGRASCRERVSSPV